MNAALTRAWIGLGANLGHPVQTLQQAVRELNEWPGHQVVAVSSLWRSAPVDAQGPDFWNAVVGIDTSNEPLDLLAALQAIEHRHGRQRPYLHAPRTLDLDLLLFGDAILNLPNLVVPHPRMHLRAFVLAPLQEVVPQVQIPGHGRAADLWSHVKDQALERVGPLLS